MNRINVLLVFLLVSMGAIAQNSQQENKEAGSELSALPSFGMQIDQENTLSALEMSEKYAVMKASDTLQTKFSATVTEVCQMSGCWMKLELENGQETMVRFKDYGFFMPKDIAGKEVIVNGFAFVEEMTVKDQQHFAEDAGKSKEEIAKINASKKTLSFEADGVLLKK